MSTGPIRVLIADDTADIRTLLRLTLSKDDRFEVVAEASNGAEAIELANETRPDAIVLDLAMPVMDGLEALPELRRSLPDAWIVVLSGFNASEMAGEAIALGADGYLEKGTAFGRLVKVLLETPARAVAQTGPPERPTFHVVEDKPSPVDPDVTAKEIVAAVSACTRLVEAFERFTRHVKELVSFDRASFWVTAGAPDTFECVALRDETENRLPVGAVHTVTGRARRVLSGRTVVEPDTINDDADVTNGTLRRSGIRSYVAIPLVIAGETKALVNFSSERPQAFSLQDAPLLERLVRDTASTLHLLYMLDKEREVARLRDAIEFEPA